jgi:putative flippase GtrA
MVLLVALLYEIRNENDSLSLLSVTRRVSRLGPLAERLRGPTRLGVTMPAPELLVTPLWERAARFGRSLVVGSWGTSLDFAAVALSIRLLHLEAAWARAIGLCVGGVALFFGSRSFAFRAQAESALPQARRFVVSELIGFPLNMLTFQLTLRLFPAIPPEVSSLLANFALFLAYYYPVRSRVVFRSSPSLLGTTSLKGVLAKLVDERPQSARSAAPGVASAARSAAIG